VRSRVAAVATLALLGCASASNSPSSAEAYAQALDDGHLEAAYALTSPAFKAQVSAEAFRLRFADAGARKVRAATVREGLAELQQAAPELYGQDSTEAAEAVILRFAAAVRARHFDEAWRCLSMSWRGRYSVEALTRDFEAEPTASARLERAVLAAEGIPVKDGHTVRFPVAGGGAVVVQKENDGWRLDALE
jgi:hypothetical protein